MGGTVVQIVTPAARRSRKGNRVTALRWARLLRAAGHRVRVRSELDGAPCDVLVVLHAVHGRAAVRAWVEHGRPGKLVIGLSGTDVYGDAGDLDPELFAPADRLVALQPLAIRQLPHELRGRARAILQSAAPLADPPPPREDVFEVVCAAHLRGVKEPFLAARAAARLPAGSRVEVVHAGAALDPLMAAQAEAEARSNPRWTWLGPVPRAEVLELVARARVFVQTSRHEGGANALSEALAQSTPVLATRVPGNVGVLGDAHQGLYRSGDERELARLLERCEQDAGFLDDLRAASRALVAKLAPERECAAWAALIAELAPESE
ncbi:MAG TPA: selenoneine biosynthesis selenosugar synthase SenB [Planctomycetota bacterium]|nr:selenoneine biosynthesis selenosugar synthase SenB [Planctomycetota bacterium]